MKDYAATAKEDGKKDPPIERGFWTRKKMDRQHTDSKLEGVLDLMQPPIELHLFSRAFHAYSD